MSVLFQVQLLIIPLVSSNFSSTRPKTMVSLPLKLRLIKYITLYIFIFAICLCQRSRSLFSYMNRQYMDRPGTCIILDKKNNIANSSCHFGSYGSIQTGPSPKKYYMDFRSFGPYNMFLVTDRSIYCHMTLSAMNYLLYSDSSSICDVAMKVCLLLANQITC